MANIKVSIIIPAYNVENQITTCLNSIIKQTLKDIEIIVIDDGSTDNTLSIINNFQTNDTRIKVISQENKKQGAARNCGIKIAQGEYIGFIDSDDYIDSDFFKKLYNTAKENDCDIATTNILKHKKKYNKYNVLYNHFKIAEKTNDKYKLCEDKTHRFFYMVNKIFRRSFLKENNILFPEGCYFEDAMFTTKAIYYANKIISVPNTTYHYVEFSNSTVKSKENQQKKKEDHLNSYTELQLFAKEHNIKLPERLNYTESYWKGPLKVYKGTFKTKVLLFGTIPMLIQK